MWYLTSYGQQFGKQPLPPSLPPVQVLPGERLFMHVFLFAFEWKAYWGGGGGGGGGLLKSAEVCL